STTIVLVEDITAERMAAIVAEARTQSGVIEATGRTQFNTDIEVYGAPRALPLQVFVAPPDDPMRMARFDVSGKTSWPPAADEIFLSGASLALLDVAVGDRMPVKTPGGDRVQLRVAGTVYDPSLSPSPQEQRGHAYVSTAVLVRPGEQALLDQLKLQVAEPGQTAPTRDRNNVVAAAGAVGAWLQRAQGVVFGDIQVPPPYSHPHQWQADALLGSLLAGGAASLLLGTILVANVLNGLFTQQIPQIGIMKAIGARTGHIIR